ncbi:Follicle-stimulating hormone beta subunit isoform 3 [Scophthalmus maximus]|uniref:Follicle-stimulating hormone beta subunit isoform 3 n=1 Tax=Scophthalmus maximus TaxID=52904 RepID=A0A2U9BBW0_SCOMX|nr:Follicle-stimulating hormone beta subunit isoform 3 [Scophthalmus maximus]
MLAEQREGTRLRFKAATELSRRRAFSTQQRMQLVVMAAVLAMAGTGQGCSLGCKLANITLRVESCGVTEDPNYIGNGDMDEQKICNGDWSYEAKHINGCPVAARYPVASNCRCTTCDEDSTYCGRTPRYMPSCFSR